MHRRRESAVRLRRGRKRPSGMTDGIWWLKSPLLTENRQSSRFKPRKDRDDEKAGGDKAARPLRPGCLLLHCLGVMNALGPIEGGGRLTGRTGLGLMSIWSGGIREGRLVERISALTGNNGSKNCNYSYHEVPSIVHWTGVHCIVTVGVCFRWDSNPRPLDLVQRSAEYPGRI